MKRFHQTLAGGMLAVCALLAFAPAQAAMPPVDSQGQPVPSLAPMLQKVTPAVVNIASTGRVRVEENPEGVALLPRLPQSLTQQS